MFVINQMILMIESGGLDTTDERLVSGVARLRELLNALDVAAVAV